MTEVHAQVQRVTKVLLNTLVEPAGRRESRLCLSARKVAAPDAALLAGAIAHALDYGCQTASGLPNCSRYTPSTPSMHRA